MTTKGQLGEVAVSAADQPPAQFHRLRRLTIVGGFLDGVDIEFASGLNCIIGGRGTGKTTILEFIRYALGLFPGQHQRQHQGTVK